MIIAHQNVQHAECNIVSAVLSLRPSIGRAVAVVLYLNECVSRKPNPYDISEQLP